MTQKTGQCNFNFKKPFYQSSCYIFLSSTFSAVIGFIFWALAAKLYDPATVGIATSIISLIGLLIIFSKLGFDYSLVRFFPQGNKAEMFSTALLITTGTIVTLGLIFVNFLIDFFPEYGLLCNNSLLFIGILIVYSVTAISGMSFVAIKRSDCFLIQNLFTGLRIAFLFLFAGFGSLGILASFGISFMLASTYSIAKLISFNIGITKISVPFLRDTLYFSFGNYLTDLLYQSQNLALPIIIIYLMDASSAAYYFIAYSIASILFMVSYAVSTSLLVEGSHGENLKQKVREALFLIYPVLLCIFLLIYLLGGKVLVLIGSDYGAATELLHLIAASSFFSALFFVYQSIKRVKKEMLSSIVLNGLALIILSISCIMFTPIYGITGIGYAWLLSSAIICIIVSILLMHEMSSL